MKKKPTKNKVIKAYDPLEIDHLQLYLQKISKFPLLSKLEEEKLSKLFYENKDPKLANLLAQANLRFVIKVASEYTRFGAKLIDLIQEGNVGLLHAIKEFNPYKGVRLISYAVWWIRGYIQEYLMRQYSMVRIGTNAKQRKLFYLLMKQKKQLDQLQYTEQNKLLTYSGFKDKDIKSMQQRITYKDISLDQPARVMNNNSNTSLISLQAQTEEFSLEENINFLQETQLLNTVIKKLQPQLNIKELYILKHRLLNNTPLTLQIIGNKFKVTREAIRQIENRLLKKIKAQLINLKTH